MGSCLNFRLTNGNFPINFSCRLQNLCGSLYKHPKINTPKSHAQTGMSLQANAGNSAPEATKNGAVDASCHNDSHSCHVSLLLGALIAFARTSSQVPVNIVFPVSDSQVWASSRSLPQTKCAVLGSLSSDPCSSRAVTARMIGTPLSICRTM